jgi:hypothetical protein
MKHVEHKTEHLMFEIKVAKTEWIVIQGYSERAERFQKYITQSHTVILLLLLLLLFIYLFIGNQKEYIL